MKSLNLFLRYFPPVWIAYFYIESTKHGALCLDSKSTSNLHSSFTFASEEDKNCQDLTNKSLQCKDGCTVLVHNIGNTYQSCKNYCESHIRRCLGAWDEDGDTCNARGTYGCDFKFTFTSDVLCKCSKEKKAGGLFKKGNNGGHQWKFGGADPKCPTGQVSHKGYVQYPPKDGNYDEISMIAISEQKWHGQTVIWFSNDKDEKYIYASALNDGKNLCRIELDVPYSIRNDIESMSLGPCNTNRNKKCLYVANIGNNQAQVCTGRPCGKGRRFLQIYKFKEPTIKSCYNSGNFKAKVAILPIHYRGASSPADRANAESFFVDPTGDKNNGKPGDLYIVTKWHKDKHELTRLFKYPVHAHRNIRYGRKRHAYPVQATKGKELMKHTWTDADMSTDGSLIALRGVNSIYFFTRNPSESVAEALKKKPCDYVYETKTSKEFALNATEPVQYSSFEAVGFVPGQKAFIEISECKSENYGNCNPHAFTVRYKE